MPFVWKSQLRVDLAVEKTKTEHLRLEIARLNEYVVKCENLIDHERNRVTDERERADRVNDALLQQNGLPASTATVRQEQAEYQTKADDAFEKRRKEFEEIYSESVEELIGDNDTSIVQDVKDLIGSAVQ